VNRQQGETGICGAANRIRISSAFAHFGEEKPLVGRNGSGTIFFSHCGLLCVYCQNWEISHQGSGYLISPEGLADRMIRLQKYGCHNINLVTPTHFLPDIVSALDLAAGRGLKLPTIYNTSGYERVEILRLLDGVIDIYMPNYKYDDKKIAARYSNGAHDYPERARKALVEMMRQVGKLKIDERGIAISGLLIRHLVLPGGLAGTTGFVRFVAEKLGPDSFINIMSQYRPFHQAREYPEINRRITKREFNEAMTAARDAGLHNFL
jgi:putative pyruvate formate lyase activating enzyme